MEKLWKRTLYISKINKSLIQFLTRKYAWEMSFSLVIISFQLYSCTLSLVAHVRYRIGDRACYPIGTAQYKETILPVYEYLYYKDQMVTTVFLSNWNPMHGKMAFIWNIAQVPSAGLHLLLWYYFATHWKVTKPSNKSHGLELKDKVAALQIQEWLLRWSVQLMKHSDCVMKDHITSLIVFWIYCNSVLSHGYVISPAFVCGPAI